MNEVKVKIDVWEGRIGETGIVQFQSVDLANMFLRMMNQRVIAEEIRGYLKSEITLLWTEEKEEYSFAYRYDIGGGSYIYDTEPIQADLYRRYTYTRDELQKLTDKDNRFVEMYTDNLKMYEKSLRALQVLK
ncbi:hypothetical protein [Bacillus cereus]|uniref:hypothetical protein n=1 Tax=Bacillus cereus TaxID=1396 RepID=UPI003A92CA12